MAHSKAAEQTLRPKHDLFSQMVSIKRTVVLGQDIVTVICLALNRKLFESLTGSAILVLQLLPPFSEMKKSLHE